MPAWIIPAIFGAGFAVYTAVLAVRVMYHRAREAAHFAAWERELASERTGR